MYFIAMCLFFCTVCLSQVAVTKPAVGRGEREAEGADGGWPNGEENTHSHIQPPTRSGLGVGICVEQGFTGILHLTENDMHDESVMHVCAHVIT